MKKETETTSTKDVQWDNATPETPEEQPTSKKNNTLLIGGAVLIIGAILFMMFFKGGTPQENTAAAKTSTEEGTGYWKDGKEKLVEFSKKHRYITVAGVITGSILLGRGLAYVLYGVARPVAEKLAAWKLMPKRHTTSTPKEWISWPLKSS